MSLTNSSPLEVAQAAQSAFRTLAVLSTSARNEALQAIHDGLLASKKQILEANKHDMELAIKGVESGLLSHSLVKRLDLSRSGKYDEMLQGIINLKKLEDPLGQVDYRTLLDDGLSLERISSPIGVLLIIFEARPEVIANIASLAIKSGNAAILKGGKELIESFRVISTVISDALSSTQVPNDAIQLVETRDAIGPLLKLHQYIDLVIPRGGNELVRSVKSSTEIAVIGHAEGLCSMYLRADYGIADAINVIADAKLSYTAACNSIETLLIDQAALYGTFPQVAQVLMEEKGIELRCDGASKAAIASTLQLSTSSKVTDATEQDYRTEFLDQILAVKTVANIDEAIAHINTYSSHHTDAILTNDSSVAEKFLQSIDSAGVFWNTSTRMADGHRFGFGTEVGISTNKLHARGPVGLEGLTTYRYLLRGHGQVSRDYGAGEGGKSWKHQRLAAGNTEWIARDEEELEALRRFRAMRIKEREKEMNTTANVGIIFE